jgi:hypothetical protein
MTEARKYSTRSSYEYREGRREGGKEGRRGGVLQI